MPLNFGRWLGRLGYKTAEQPLIGLDRVQAVAIVADHTHLVPHPISVSYIVGARVPNAPAARFASFVCQSPVPVRIRELALSSTILDDCRFQIGAAPGSALANTVFLTPQHMRLGATALAAWYYGDRAAALGVDFPTVQLTGTTTAHIIRTPIYVPAGGFFHINFSQAAQGIRVWIIADELPPEDSQ